MQRKAGNIETFSRANKERKEKNLQKLNPDIICLSPAFHSFWHNK